MSSILFGLMAAPSSAGTGNLLWQVLYLCFVFGLVLLLVYLATRLWARRGLPLGARNRHLQLLESLPLSVGKGLHIIRVPDGVWIVATHEKGVTLLKELSDSAAFTAPEDNSSSLAAWLEGRFQREGSRITDEDTKEHLGDLGAKQSGSFAGQLRQRLQDLKERKE